MWALDVFQLSGWRVAQLAWSRRSQAGAAGANRWDDRPAMRRFPGASSPQQWFLSNTAWGRSARPRPGPSQSVSLALCGHYCRPNWTAEARRPRAARAHCLRLPATPVSGEIRAYTVCHCASSHPPCRPLDTLKRASPARPQHPQPSHCYLIPVDRRLATSFQNISSQINSNLSHSTTYAPLAQTTSQAALRMARRLC